MTTFLITSLKAYKAHISPALRPACRFIPTCSEYGAEAISRHGAGRGLLLLAKRLLRCNRFFPGGWDPAP